MNIQGLSAAATEQNSSRPAEQIEKNRNRQFSSPELLSGTDNSEQVQPEELINQIKALTENGVYSVQFESSENSELIVKVVDRETSEVIRQIPPEELLELSEHLKELKGLLVDTVG